MLAPPPAPGTGTRRMRWCLLLLLLLLLCVCGSTVCRARVWVLLLAYGREAQLPQGEGLVEGAQVTQPRSSLAAKLGQIYLGVHYGCRYRCQQARELGSRRTTRAARRGGGPSALFLHGPSLPSA